MFGNESAIVQETAKIHDAYHWPIRVDFSDPKLSDLRVVSKNKTVIIGALGQETVEIHVAYHWPRIRDFLAILNHSINRPWGYKTFFKLSLAEHEISTAYKCWNVQNLWKIQAQNPKPCIFFLLVNVKMPTINCWHFNINEQDKIKSQLCWAWDFK